MANKVEQERLKDLFEYRDGHLYWIKLTANRAKLGSQAGFYCQNGYYYLSIDNTKIKRSRCIWIYHNGSIPDGMMVDHENRIRIDDRIENLRLATCSENGANTPRRKSSTTKFRGVRLRSDHKKWCARIMVDQKELHLGSFETEEQAAQAFDSAAIKHYGTFAVLNFPEGSK